MQRLNASSVALKFVEAYGINFTDVNYTLTADISRVLAGKPPRATLYRIGSGSPMYVAPSSPQKVVILKGDPRVKHLFYLVFEVIAPGIRLTSIQIMASKTQ